MKPFMLKVLTIASTFALFLWGTSCTEVIKPPDNSGPDTTSHDFTFEVFTFGDGSSSTLYDVAIIDENNIWAVGEIYVKDSTGEVDPLPYNAVQWDGAIWTLQRITVNFRGNMITPPLEGIFAFSSDQIWMVGSLPIFGDGSNWTMYDLRTTLDPNVSLSRTWGSNTQNMYFVGSNGSIVHYNGSTWQKIESGTTLHINDIWGISQQGGRILAVVPSPSQGETKILSIVNQSVVESQPWPVGLAGVWISPDDTAYVSGIGGMWMQKDTAWQLVEGLPDSIIYASMRGNADNDLFLEGATLMHFNGGSWYEYSEIPNEIEIRSIAIKQDMVVAVGYTVQGISVDRAAIIIGKRQ